MIKAFLEENLYQYEAKYALEFRQYLSDVLEIPLSLISLFGENGDEIRPNVYLNENEMYRVRVRDMDTYSYNNDDRNTFFKFLDKDNNKNNVVFTPQGFVDLEKVMELEKNNIFKYTFQKRYFYDKDILDGEEKDEDSITIGIDMSKMNEHDFLNRFQIKNLDDYKLYIHYENAYTNAVNNFKEFNVDVTDKKHILGIVCNIFVKKQLIILVKKSDLKKVDYIDILFDGFFLSDKKYRNILASLPIITNHTNGYYHVSNYMGEIKLISDNEMEDSNLQLYLYNNMKEILGQDYVSKYSK